MLYAARAASWLSMLVLGWLDTIGLHADDIAMLAENSMHTRNIIVSLFRPILGLYFLKKKINKINK